METESDVITYQHFRIPFVFKAKRKSMPPPELLFLWTRKKGFEINGFPLEKRWARFAKRNGGMTVCIIKTPSSETFRGVMHCSMSQPYDVDYGEDTALNRARVAQGHDCAYCRHIIDPVNGPTPQGIRAENVLSVIDIPSGPRELNL